jgi:hypothetical protein
MFDDSTPLSALTVGDLRPLMSDLSSPSPDVVVEVSGDLEADPARVSDSLGAVLRRIRKEKARPVVVASPGGGDGERVLLVGLPSLSREPVSVAGFVGGLLADVDACRSVLLEAVGLLDAATPEGTARLREIVEGLRAQVMQPVAEETLDLVVEGLSAEAVRELAAEVRARMVPQDA